MSPVAAAAVTAEAVEGVAVQTVRSSGTLDLPEVDWRRRGRVASLSWRPYDSDAVVAVGDAAVCR